MDVGVLRKTYLKTFKDPYQEYGGTQVGKGVCETQGGARIG